jgi:hypothetical protein
MDTQQLEQEGLGFRCRRCRITVLGSRGADKKLCSSCRRIQCTEE